MGTAVRTGVGFSSDVSIELPKNPSSVALGRHWLEDLISGHPYPLNAERLFEAVLCISEMITNALRHAETDCVARVAWTGDSWEIAVEDGVVDRWLAQPEGTRDEALWTSGRGLGLLAMLADEWGVKASKRLGTKTVWVAFDMERAPNERKQCVPNPR